MKKVLMVMGFALCASVAFAQTTRIAPKDDVRGVVKTDQAPAKAPVDYKASIFAKANGHDTIAVFKFDVASDYTIGQIASSDRINDTVVGVFNGHTISGDANKWMRYSSIADFRNTAPSRMSGLVTWLTPTNEQGQPIGDPDFEYITDELDPSLSPREPADDGFMLISYMEGRANAGRINCYFTLPTVQRPANARMIEVSLTQAYRKYYDQCFIDYQVNGKWFAREINVDGIDMSVNTWGAVKARFVMPHALNSETNINLRIRAYSSTRNVSIFGYFWGVDNVAVMALTLDEYWALNSPTKIDGFYGMIPQGMSIPLTYGVNAQNLSTNPINNAKVTVNAGTNRNSLTEVFHGSGTNVLPGSFDSVYPILLDERGFFVQDADVTSGYQSWPYESENYGNATGTLTGGFQGRGLPVATQGKNFYSLNVAGGSLSRTYDTILYYVSNNLDFNYATTGREGGYRWAHDNGIISSGAFFATAFTDPDASGNVYVTDNGFTEGGHAGMEGYAVHTRYITGNDVPQGWVIRGLELIAATDREVSDMDGGSIIPIAYKDDYDAETGYLYYRNLPCGIDGLAFTVQEDQINDQLYTNGGYITPDQGYKAINIQFVEQPALEPNTSYRFGFRLNDATQFAVAGTRNRFRFMNDTGATVNVPFGYTGAGDTGMFAADYAAAAAAANDYHYVPTPGTYMEVIVYDAHTNRENKSIYAWNIDNYPMIRPIVGPARPVEYATLEGDCLDNTAENANEPHGVMISRGSDDFCNGELEVTAGSQQRIDFVPIGDYSVIDSVLLDGVKLTPYDENTGEGDYYANEYNVYQNPDEETGLLLQRDWWAYYMSDLAANSHHIFTVYSHYEEHNIIGIDPVAPEVSLGIAPNPATSTVKVNVKGINGMVNCSILDMSGRVIYNANINAENEHMVNVSNFPAGAYFVRVTNDSFSKIEKLIIK